ncbi:MAG: FadR/GntR family transcriptional regulator [Thermohalobaculum sp.]|nr:FadR/GntR family transcriptional regulator [Thermohalobaculum sp.]
MIDALNDPGPAAGQGGRRATLSAGIAAALRAIIDSGEVAVGGRLPSTASLTARFGVSRTVVREAIASLQADGLVQPRQGAGVFVLARAPQAPLPFVADAGRVSSVIELLEIRTALEVESAALASQRRSPAQEEAIHEACADIERLIEAERMTARADLAFHLAIADATNNPRFREFLALMGEGAIPRHAFLSGKTQDMPRDYLRQIQDEHRAIADAISARDERGAREAMRAHLAGSQARYRRLLRDSVAR